MKKLNYLLFAMLSVIMIFSACKDDDDEPEQIMVNMGAQENAATGAFYSVAENKTYAQDAAFQAQDKIDILCFFEVAGGNNIALASPGSGITGIFTGNSSVENWTTTDTTFFCTTTLTPDQFDALTETDALIESSYDPANARKKAKDMKVGDVYSIKIQSGQYGMLKVTSVTQGADGAVSFELKMKK